MTEQHKSCSCYRCTAPCRMVPGWFTPGEAEMAAEHLGMSLRKFFKRYLMVTFRSRNPKVFALSPRTLVAKGGEEAPGAFMGVCVFLKDGKCSIHSVKPYECRAAYHDDTDEIDDVRKDRLIEAWQDHQDQIKELLGRQHPRAFDFDMSTGRVFMYGQEEDE